MKYELRKNGDLVLFAFNGDPVARFQRDQSILSVSSGRHFADSRAEVLTQRSIEVIRSWCDEALSREVAA